MRFDIMRRCDIRAVTRKGLLLEFWQGEPAVVNDKVCRVDKLQNDATTRLMLFYACVDDTDATVALGSAQHYTAYL